MIKVSRLVENILMSQSLTVPSPLAVISSLSVLLLTHTRLYTGSLWLSPDTVLATPLSIIVSAQKV